MTTEFESDFTELTDHEEAKKHPAYAAFVLDMKGRLYGHEALNDAWAWFEAGWDARALAAPPAGVGAEVAARLAECGHVAYRDGDCCVDAGCAHAAYQVPDNPADRPEALRVARIGVDVSLRDAAKLFGMKPSRLSDVEWGREVLVVREYERMIELLLGPPAPAGTGGRR